MAARELAEDTSVVGVIGPFESGCARTLLPGLNEILMPVVSPANTDVGLTHQGPGTVEGEPDRYYPTGVRTYARLVPPDDAQGRAGAKAMAALGVTKVCVLDDRDTYGKSVADAFALGAKDEGLEVVCRRGWRHGSQETNYLALMEQVKASGADGIYVGGLSNFGGAQLIQDKLAVVGDNEAVKLVVSDGFVVNKLFEEAGQASLEGMYGTTPALSPQDLTGAGRGVRGGVRGEARRPEDVHGVRRRRGAGPRGRDRALERDAGRCGREAPRDEPRGRDRRPGRLRPERRPPGRAGRAPPGAQRRLGVRRS